MPNGCVNAIDPPLKANELAISLEKAINAAYLGFIFSMGISSCSTQ
jgi:hypothetical protein